MSESEHVTTVRGTVDPSDFLGDVVIGLTYEQASLMLFRSVGHIKGIVTRNKLRRYLIRGPGSRYCWITLLPKDTVLWLREHIHGKQLRKPRGG